MTDKPISKFDFTQSFLDKPGPQFKASDYIIAPGLRKAVEVAILLKQPLLLTGEPGTGKTRLAEKLAADLYESHPKDYLSQPLIFHTKTISSYSDLFYIYDALSHFHDAHLSGDGQSTREGPLQPSKYIQLQAFGQALILSDPKSAEAPPYRLTNDVVSDETFKFDGLGARSSVVLIDEVDKAPRDFTNDLLNELDRFEFSVKEDGNRRFKKGSKNIFLILTSNSEKNLPEAFLRRCIFYHIEFPKPEQLQEIVMNQLRQQLSEATDMEMERINGRLSEYITLFSTKLRNSSADKRPATAELITWIFYLIDDIRADRAITDISRDKLIASYSIIAKEKNELARLTGLFA
ncbi:MAG: MoxR family ATPase [Chryseolinea sp.]